MGRLRNALLMVLMAVPLACSAPAPPPSPQLGKIAERPWEPMKSAEYRMATAKLGPMPNSGLLLPVVSPDGQWIASLQTPPNSPVSLEDFIRGDRCEGNSLLLRQTTPDAPARAVCEAGAMWAAWSPAGGTLVFTARGSDGRGELGIHDLASGATSRRAVGPRRLAMPAVSPSGNKIALVNADNFPASSQIYIMDLSARTFQPGPPLSEGSRQLWPQWVDEQTLVFLDWTREPPTRPAYSAEAAAKAGSDSGGGAASSLCRWTAGQDDVQTVAPLGSLPTTFAVLQLLVSISGPVSPDGKAWVCYDRLADHLTVVDLAKGTRRSLAEQTRAACWMGPDLLAAADKDLFVYTDKGPAEGSRLLRGLWVPLWASREGDTILLCTLGFAEDAFELVRVYLVWRR
ncbi:MAG: hypothetical protein MUP47_01980 [Phycisphaerae bacterium]|nr:hypothetical protein [Phycisphaerae bacterium]